MTVPVAVETDPASLTANPVAARVTGVSKVYGDGEAAVYAVAAISLDVERAEFTAIMGPSGSGKSTLMQCMAGLDRFTDGRSWLGSTEITSLNERRLTRVRRDMVGFIFQAYNLVPTLTVRENILLPLSIAGRKADADWLDAVVEALGLGDRMTHRPSELSGGQQQRAAAARALVARPDADLAG